MRCDRIPKADLAGKTLEMTEEAYREETLSQENVFAACHISQNEKIRRGRRSLRNKSSRQ